MRKVVRFRNPATLVVDTASGALLEAATLLPGGGGDVTEADPVTDGFVGVAELMLCEHADRRRQRPRAARVGCCTDPP